MKASIVVPAHNSTDTIGECLESILRQTGVDYEVIVVDDGSTDNTGELAGKYPVKVITQEKRGPAAARNNGAMNAAGEILVFTDSDCVVGESWLQEMLKPFSDPSIIGVQGRYLTKQKGVVARFAQYEIAERYERMSKARFIDFLGSYSAAYRREVFLKEGGFDESYPIASGEDPDLSYRLYAKGCKMVFNPGAVVYHRHPDTLLKYLKRKFYRAYWRVPLYKKNRDKAISDSYTPQSLKLQIGISYLLVPAVLVPKLFAILLVLLFVSTLPLSIRVLRKDWKVGLAAPVFLILRTMVFSAGLIFGLLKERKY